MFKTHINQLIGKRMALTGERTTQAQIQEATGIPQATLSRWYQGQISRLEYDTTAKLAEFFQCGLCDLVSLQSSDSEG